MHGVGVSVYLCVLISCVLINCAVVILYLSASLRISPHHFFTSHRTIPVRVGWHPYSLHLWLGPNSSLHLPFTSHPLGGEWGGEGGIEEWLQSHGVKCYKDTIVIVNNEIESLEMDKCYDWGKPVQAFHEGYIVIKVVSVLYTLPHLLHFFSSRMASFTSLSLHLRSPTSQLHMTGFCLGELHNPSTTSSTSLPPHDTFMPSFFPHSHSLQSLHPSPLIATIPSPTFHSSFIFLLKPSLQFLFPLPSLSSSSNLSSIQTPATRQTL